MTFESLYEYLKLYKEDTITDTKYDVTIYYYWKEPSERSEWDNAVLNIAKHLQIKGINEWNIICNISELIESHIDELNESHLFWCNVGTEQIMEDIGSYFDENVSEEWMKKFSEILCK